MDKKIIDKKKKNKEKGKNNVGFFKNLKAEMSKIVWPTKKELIHDSSVSIAIAFVLVLCISFITMISDQAISFILSLFA